MKDFRKIYKKEKKNLPFWERKIGMLKGKSILESQKAKNKEKVVYKVLNVNKIFQENFGLKNLDLRFDVTELKKGVIKTQNFLQPFQTFGHLHEKYRGEFYYVLKGDVIFFLVNSFNGNSIVKELKKDEWTFIHPIFIHKTIAKKDSEFLGIVPRDAGHNYKIVEKVGLPFYPIIKKGKIVFYKAKWKSEFQPKLERIETIVQNDLPELSVIKNVLFYPDEHKVFY